MRSTEGFTRLSIASVVAVALVIACNDSPAAPVLGADNVAYSAQDDVPGKIKKGDVQFARVRGGDGALVGGTALSSTRLSEGTYLLTFEPPIGGCAATANSAAFLGFDASVFRTSVQVSIGSGLGGAWDDESVGVRTFDSSDGSSEDTSFALILVCP